MLYIPHEMLRILQTQFKAGKHKVTCRVEIDKFSYDPNITMEYDSIQYYSTPIVPVVLGTNPPNVTSAVSIGSPIQGVTLAETMAKKTSDFAVQHVNGKQRTLNGVTRNHEGTDFGFVDGDVVTACADGIVTEVQPEGKDSYINILHANNVMTRYLHINRFVVSLGEQVTQGQAIAQISPSGAYSHHLHLEIRVDASKDSYGDPRDPMAYLDGTASIGVVPVFEATGTATVGAEGVRFREKPNTSATIIAVLPAGTVLNVIGLEGEWLNIEHQQVKGYVYRPATQYGGTVGGQPSEQSDRPGGNPSFQEVYNELTRNAIEVGLPPQIAYASAWIESDWSHYVHATGEVLVSYANAVGMMQIVPTAWADEFDVDQMRNDWRYNVYAGVRILRQCYDLAVNHGEDAYTDGVARSTWCVYNGWTNLIARYRNNPNQDDVKYYDYYLNSPWSSNITTANPATVPSGIVTKAVSDVRVEPIFAEGNEKLKVTAGTLMEIVNTIGDWYEVRLASGDKGFIHSKDFKEMTEAITTKFMPQEVIKEDFSSATPGSLPKGFVQDSSNSWSIVQEGDNNALGIAGGAIGDQYVMFTAKMQYAGRVDFTLSTELSSDNSVDVFIDNALIYKGKTSTSMQTISFSLTQGNHVIKVVRHNVAGGACKVIIDNIQVLQYYYKDYSDDNLVTPSVFASTTFSLIVKGDSVNVLQAPEESAQVLLVTSRGYRYPCVEHDDTWATVRLSDNTLAYINISDKARAEVKEEGAAYNQLYVKTGGFVYDTTLTFDYSVVSINIDSRYDMRGATAEVVIADVDGMFSPHYNPTAFKTGLSEWSTLEKGVVYGTLVENTPIRIYLGYGDAPPRRFTGLIQSVDVKDNKTIAIQCVDRMKMLNDYVLRKQVEFPPDGSLLKSAWLVSSIIHELAKIAGMDKWRIVADDVGRVDIVVEETYYTEINDASGYYIAMDEQGKPREVLIESLPDDGGYRNPFWTNKIYKKGICIADAIEDLTQGVNFWARCDRYGTLFVTSTLKASNVSYTFTDTTNLISLSHSVDPSRTRNHLIVTGSNADEEFFDKQLFRSVLGVRKTAQINAPWADTYGKKLAIAKKFFHDIKVMSNSVTAAVEGNPYIDLFDRIYIENRRTTTKSEFHVKGIKDSYSSTDGYVTILDLFTIDEEPKPI
jgi:SH3-like domain-containing protein